MRKIPLRILLLFLFKHQLAPSAVSYQCDISLTSIQSDLSTIFLVELGRGHVMTFRPGDRNCLSSGDIISFSSGVQNIELHIAVCIILRYRCALQDNIGECHLFVIIQRIHMFRTILRIEIGIACCIIVKLGSIVIKGQNPPECSPWNLLLQTDLPDWTRLQTASDFPGRNHYTR